MPVSHIGLTVSHLPTSCSFFLSALQPLGYRFIAQHGSQIGLGINDADFFLCQETPGVKAGAAHIAFSAPSRTAVRDFYTAALNAGARPNGAPATRDEETGHFNAAILDFDGNSIEVVYRNEPDVRDDGTVIEHSRVLTWQKDVAESTRDDKSVASARDNKTVVSVRSTKSANQSIGPGSMVRSVSAPLALAEPLLSTSSSTSGDSAAKKIIGTLIGAAAGAAVAYAMVKSEQDSARKEDQFNAFMEAKAKAAQAIEQATQPKPKGGSPPSAYEQSPKSVHSAHRYISDNASSYSRSQGPRAIEPPPQSYHSPTYTSVPPTQVTQQRAIEYIPAASMAPSRAHFAAHRSVTSPEMSTYSKPRSTAPSSIISSFVADEVPRRKSADSIASGSHHSSSKKSKSPKSSYTETSKHTSKSRSRAPSPARSTSKTGSIVGSILGRNATAETVHTGLGSHKSDYYDDQIIDNLDDTDSVAPSDSISNAGSSSRRRHRSSSGKSSASVTSKHSSSSKHSKSSRHSHGSRRSHSHSHRDEKEYVSSPLHEAWIDADEFADVDARSRVKSEPSDASTVKPIRRDSGMGGWGDGNGYSYGDGAVGGGYGGRGSVASLPVRGITESMIGETRDGKKGRRSVVSYAMGQS